MNMTQSYNLIYTGLASPQHLIEATKANITANALSRTDNARLAEYFLKELDAFNANAETHRNFNLQSGNNETKVSSDRLTEYVKHIHEAKESEIKERFEQPELTRDEANELLYQMVLQPEIEKVLSESTKANKQTVINALEGLQITIEQVSKPANKTASTKTNVGKRLGYQVGKATGNLIADALKPR